MCGLNIYEITMTKRKELSKNKNKRKSIIYIQARLHAAETYASIIMKYIITELTSNYQQYDKIFENHIVKLVPMINPDGVVIGNSRCSIAGLDLNRRWAEPNPFVHPEIYFLKHHLKLVSK